MKLPWAFLVLALALPLGCSSDPPIKPAQNESIPELNEEGPTIIRAQVSPKVIELNQGFRPSQPVRITADVKDFEHDIDSVNLRFVDIPLVLDMVRFEGTTWLADLTQHQLQMLAIGGKTVEYDVEIEAENDDGDSTVFEQPLKITIRAPDPFESGPQAQSQNPFASG